MGGAANEACSAQVVSKGERRNVRLPNNCLPAIAIAKAGTTEPWGLRTQAHCFRPPARLHFTDLVYSAPQVDGAWLSPVERLLREQEAEGSNPFAPTNKSSCTVAA